MRKSPRTETSTLEPHLLSLLQYMVLPIWHTSNTVALRDEELALTVVAWLSFFLFAGYSLLVFFTRGVLSWRRSRYDVLGLVSCSAGVWAFLKYLDMHALVLGSTRVPRETEGRWQWRSLRPLALPFSYAVHQMLSLWSLYSCSPRSSRPQPLGSGGDTTPCEDTRGDHELSFNFSHQVLLQCVVFKCRCEKCNKGPQ